MGKGASDKQNGFWMYTQCFIRHKLQQELGRRVNTADLIRFGQPHWDKLSNEEKNLWKEKAKEYNRSEAGQNARMLRRLEHHSLGKQRVDQLKLSKVIPSSCRYDEIDQYSRKFFTGIDDFEAKRENDLKELIDHYQWKFTGKGSKGKESKKDFFYEDELILVTANVYYEDNLNERMIPSEISILKFSIKRGIYDRRHYILGFMNGGILNEKSRAQAEENEQITGLLMDCNRMPANIRFDYAQIWKEIKAFTKIDGDGVKLLLLSKDWNTIVGSFDTLFVRANEKSFSRIETRFSTLEDHFLALYAVLHDVRVNDEIKSDVVIVMNEPWDRAAFFDLITCDFHTGLKYTKQCGAWSCSLFTAYRAVFNFFTLCKKHVFPHEFDERHMPNKALLSTVKDCFLDYLPQQRPNLRTSRQELDYVSNENFAKQSIQLLPERETLKSDMKKISSVTESAEPGTIALKKSTSGRNKSILTTISKDG